MSGGAIQCGVYDLRFRVKTCGAPTFLWEGVLKAFYSRTWNEFDQLKPAICSGVPNVMPLFRELRLSLTESRVPPVLTYR